MVRGLLMALIGIAIALAVFRFAELGSLPADLRPAWQATTAFLLFSLYASALAAYMVWRLPARTEARLLSAAFSIAALSIAAAVIPTGIATNWDRVTLTFAFTLSPIFTFLFASRFPKQLTAEDFDGASGWSFNAIADSLAQVFYRRRWLVWLLMAAFLPLNFVMSGPEVAYRYNLFYTSVDSPHAWLAVLRSAAFVLVPAIQVALIWAGYRRATSEEQRKAQWILLGGVCFLMWAAFFAALLLLARNIDVGWLHTLWRAVNDVTLQVLFFVGITAPFIAVLYGGAMDLKPVIQRTSLFSLLLLGLTVLFASVEQLVSSQLVNRLGLPEGTGSWMGGVVVALALMPLQDRIKSWLKRFDR